MGSFSDEKLLAIMVLSLYEVSNYTVSHLHSRLSKFSWPAGNTMAAKTNSINKMNFLNIRVEECVILMELWLSWRLDNSVMHKGCHPSPILPFRTQSPPSLLNSKASSRRQSSRDTSYSGTIHVYSSLSHAVVWNAYRTTRIILKSIMMKLLRLLETYRGCDEDLSIQVAMSSIWGLIDEVCASISFFTGEYRDTSTRNDGNSKIIAEDHKGVRDEVKASEIAHLSFPLYTITNFAVSGTSYLQQQWIRSRLLSVSHAASYTILEQFVCS